MSDNVIRIRGVRPLFPEATERQADGQEGAKTMNAAKATNEEIETLKTLTSEPAIIAWARTADRAIVRSLIEGLSGSRKAASRGLQGRDLADLQRAMGTYKAASIGPREEDDGRKLVLPSTPPSIYRASLARKAGAR